MTHAGFQSLLDTPTGHRPRPVGHPAASRPFTDGQRALGRNTASGAGAGFRELLPTLLQWTDNAGNCAVLLSSSGHALLVDDGLCQWMPLPERAARHRQVMDELKRAYQIQRIITVTTWKTFRRWSPPTNRP